MDADEILATFKIPTPCPMDWDLMRGDDRVRFCGRCGKDVYNLTTMSLDEVASLLSGVRERGERRCVRLYQRPDGTLTTSACQPALSAQGRTVAVHHPRHHGRHRRVGGAAGPREVGLGRP